MMPRMVDYRDDPTAQIFADTEAATARMRRTAEAAGCRVLSTLRLDDGIDTASMAVRAALVLVEIEGETSGEAAIPLLDWLQQEAESGSCRGVVSAPAALVDLVAASANHAGIAHLCGARTENCPPGLRTGDQISPPGGYVGGGLQRLTDLAINPAGDVWVMNNWNVTDSCFLNTSKSEALSTRCGGNGVTVFYGMAKPVRAPQIGPARQP